MSLGLMRRAGGGIHLEQALPFLGPDTCARRFGWPSSEFIFAPGVELPEGPLLLKGRVSLSPRADALHGVPIERFAWARMPHDFNAPDWDVVRAAPYLMAEWHRMRALKAKMMADRGPL